MIFIGVSKVSLIIINLPFTLNHDPKLEVPISTRTQQAMQPVANPMDLLPKDSNS